jgi:hypothetical protein
MRHIAGLRLLWQFVAAGACIVGTLLLVNWLFGSVAIVGDTLTAGAMLAAVLLAIRAGRARYGWGPMTLVTAVVGLLGGVLIGRLDGHLGAMFLVSCFFGLLLDMVDASPHPTAHSTGKAAPTPAAPRPGIARADLRRRVRSR